MAEQVICLSDSDEEFIENKKRNTTDNNPRYSNTESEFSFPSVDFHYCVNKKKSVVNYVKENNCKIQKSNVTSGTSTVIESASHNETAASRLNDLLIKYNVTDDSHGNHEPQVNSATFLPVELEREPRRDKKMQSKKPQQTRDIFDDGTDRINAKDRATRDKLLRSAETKNRKNIQAGECLKFMQINIDRELENFSFHLDILNELRNHNISWKLDSFPVPNSVSWIRNTEKYYVNAGNEICKHVDNQIEKQILVIWKYDKIVRSIKDGIFNSTVESIASFSDQQLTLILYRMEEYFGKKLNKQISGRNNGTAEDRDELPKISRYDLEVCLAEIQLTLGCNSRLVETDQELAMLVYQFTKSIAEIPLKLEKRQKIGKTVDWYAMGDNRDTVRVDKDGNGLQRLWQQQLCQFNLASLEIADAISSAYPSPQELMLAYANSTPSVGEKLLRDIPIRRAAGPLSTVRKIGPELSKKIFIMFTSNDGEAILGN